MGQEIQMGGWVGEQAARGCEGCVSEAKADNRNIRASENVFEVSY
jgi:hypothetical protein